MNKICVLALGLMIAAPAFAEQGNRDDRKSKVKPTRYFSCVVQESRYTKNKKKRNVNVTVKFAVKGLDFIKYTGELLQYPGTEEDSGMISVSPLEVGKYSTMMSNLNGQGGDLRVVDGGHVKLWGDGAGYQFTDLVIWDVNNIDEEEEVTELEGYVRDYGPTYGDSEIFKQFIKCKSSLKQL